MSFQYVLCLIFMLAIVVVADRFFPILRDIPVADGTAGNERPYSLGRVQMAFWTIIVVASLVYIYWIGGSGKGAFPTVDENLVILMGISGATGIIAAAVDISKDKSVESAHAEFTGTATAINSLDAQILAMGASRATAPGDPMLAKLLADRAAKMEDLARQHTDAQRSQRDDERSGFLRDLLTDQNGNSLHRLQLVVFTLLYGAYVIWHVSTAADADALAKSLSDKLLSPEALALMGVASGVYVGFKVPGKAA